MTLEKLLNILCEKGWKPRGKDQKFEIWIENLPYKKIRVCLKKPDYDYYVYSYRDLVSKESGLWQFVCENKLVEHGVYTRAKWQRRKKYDNYWNKDISVDKPEYRLIESALKDESELEQFLLQSIVIDNE